MPGIPPPCALHAARLIVIREVMQRRPDVKRRKLALPLAAALGMGVRQIQRDMRSVEALDAEIERVRALIDGVASMRSSLGIKYLHP